MNKYPKRPVNEYDRSHDSELAYLEVHGDGRRFVYGSAAAHAKYLIEMSRRHPIMYWCWYRHWMLSLLHEEEHKKIDQCMKKYLDYDYRPFWADFALYHPIQFLVFLFVRNIFQLMKKFTSFLVNVVRNRFVKFFTAKDVLDDALIDDKTRQRESQCATELRPR
jgi:hypothetical protein